MRRLRNLMRDTPVILMELKVVEQRYSAVFEVLDGIPVTEVAGWLVTGRRNGRPG
jgi:hypothetical protein